MECINYRLLFHAILTVDNCYAKTSTTFALREQVVCIATMTGPTLERRASPQPEPSSTRAAIHIGKFRRNRISGQRRLIFKVQGGPEHERAEYPMSTLREIHRADRGPDRAGSAGRTPQGRR